MKGDQEILMNDKFKLLYEDEETIALVIKNVSLNDRGEYHVIATNLSGVAEDTINLDVKGNTVTWFLVIWFVVHNVNCPKHYYFF